jgi:hypothetical protein
MVANINDTANVQCAKERPVSNPSPPMAAFARRYRRAICPTVATKKGGCPTQ